MTWACLCVPALVALGACSMLRECRLMLPAADEQFFTEEQARHEAAYLAGTSPRQQSGFGRDARDWERFRRVIVIGTRVGPLYESDDDYGQIIALAIARDHQRRGVGRMLMHAAESMLVARGVCVLVVSSGNRRADAHAFYEKNGYAFTGRRYKKTVSSA